MWEIMIINEQTNERDFIYTTRPNEVKIPDGWIEDYCEYID